MRAPGGACFKGAMADGKTRASVYLRHVGTAVYSWQDFSFYCRLAGGRVVAREWEAGDTEEWRGPREYD